MDGQSDRDGVLRLMAALAHAAAGIEGRLRQLDPVLTLSQTVALQRIAEQTGLRPFQLAAQMNISRQLAWQTCKRLQSLGLLAMGDLSAGKRGVVLTVTPEGESLLSRATELLETVGATLTRAKARDLNVLRAGLVRLAAAAAGDETVGRSDQAGGRRHEKGRKAAGHWPDNDGLK